MFNLQYKELYGAESCSGIQGAVGVKILAATSADVDLKDSEISKAVYAAATMIESAIQASVYKRNPEIQQRKLNEAMALREVFPAGEVIYFQAIPNGYSSQDPYWSQFPWFIATTRVGHIKIGCRKRVIEISWEGTKGGLARDLFPDENVTKEGQMIHAWDLNKARDYVRAVMEDIAKNDTDSVMALLERSQNAVG